MADRTPNAENAIRRALTGTGWLAGDWKQAGATLSIDLPVEAMTESVLDELASDDEAVAELARAAGLIGPHDCPECGAQDICIVGGTTDA